LRDKEVVLTFDDGPWPGNTPAVPTAYLTTETRSSRFLEASTALCMLVMDGFAEPERLGTCIDALRVLARSSDGDRAVLVERYIDAGLP
jgi:hypothetical protein